LRASMRLFWASRNIPNMVSIKTCSLDVIAAGLYAC
jgi:hypothetical protein